MTESESLDETRRLLYIAQLCWMQSRPVPIEVQATLVNSLAYHHKLHQDWETRQLFLDMHLIEAGHPPIQRKEKDQDDILGRIHALISIITRRIEGLNDGH